VVGVRPGRAVSAAYDYLIGVDKPEVVSRFLEEEHWPLMRKVGGWTMMLTDDMRRVAPLWLQFTEDVRTAPFGREVWFKMGDSYVTDQHPRPWISEMYGYVFGAARAGVDHLVNREMMLYPTYTPDEKPPYLLHYGLEVKIGENYTFDKHFFTSGDRLACPVQLFAEPPKVEDIMAKMYPAGGRAPPVRERERLELAIFTVTALNAALTEHSAGAAGCPVCVDCVDGRPSCGEWAGSGECEKNPGFMKATCKLSCAVCDCAPGGGAEGAAAALRGGGVVAQAKPLERAEPVAARVLPRVAAEQHANSVIREAALKEKARREEEADAEAKAEKAEKKTNGAKERLADSEEAPLQDILAEAKKTKAMDRAAARTKPASRVKAAASSLKKKVAQLTRGGSDALRSRAAVAEVGEEPSVEERSALVAGLPIALPLAFLYCLSRLYRRSGRGKKTAALAQGAAVSRYED